MSEFRLIEAEDSTPGAGRARTILPKEGIILPTEFDRVRTPMRRRLPPNEVLSRNMKEKGISAPELVRRAAAKGYEISRNTINYILRGDTENPGLFTIEAIAVALEKAPEQLAAEFFGLKSDDPTFKGSQFAMLHEFYQSFTPSQKQRAEQRMSDLLLVFQHIKSQK